MNDRHSLQAKTVNMRYPAIIIYRNCSSAIANPLKRNADATAITPLTYANVALFFKKAPFVPLRCKNDARVVSLIDLFESLLGPRIGYRCTGGF